MKRRSLALLLFIFGVLGFADAQTMTVSSSSLTDASGTPINGTITFQPMTKNGQPASYKKPGGGQVTIRPISVPVVNGAFSTTLPDVSQTIPLNVCFSATLKTTTGWGLGPGYSCLQPSPTASWCSGTTCNFDNYNPDVPAITLSQPYVSTITGTSAASGSITFTGPGVTQTSSNTFNFGSAGSWPGFPTAGIVVTDGTQWLPSLTAPAGALVGTIDTQILTHKNLTDATNTFPTFNQNTTGTAAGLTNAYIDWNALSGGASILNKPTFQTPITLTTVGSSGAATFDGTTLNIPQYSGGAGGIGSITWSVPSFMTASPSTLSANGTETFSFNNQSANTFLAGPTTGVAAAPSFRTIVAADIPTLNQSTTGNAATATAATNLGGTTVDAIPYQSGSATTSYLSPQTVNGDYAMIEHVTASAAVAPTWNNAPALSAANMTNFPTLNQNTTGTAAGLTNAYIDWNAISGGASISNKPTLGTASTHPATDFTSSAVVPSTTPTAGQMLVGNAGNTAYTPVSMSGDCTVASTGAITCAKTSGTSFSSLATMLGASAGDIIYWNGSTWTKLTGNATGTQYLSENASGVPSWSTPGGGGNVSNSGTPTNGQIAQWTSATVIQGISTVPIANGGTNAATVTAALSNLAGNPAAGTYSLNCTSISSCGVTAVTGGGNVSNSGTPTNGQLAVWTNATTVQGVTTLPTAAMPTLTGDVSNSGLTVTVTHVSPPYKSDVTAQSISQSPVTLASGPSAGHWIVEYYADQNATCTTGSNQVSFQFNWTDGTSSRKLTTGSMPMGSSQSTSGYLTGTFSIWVGSGDVTYTSTVTGACASGTSSYDIHADMVKR